MKYTILLISILGSIEAININNWQNDLEWSFLNRISNIQNWEPFNNGEEESLCVIQWNHYLEILRSGNFFPNNMWALKSKQGTYTTIDNTKSIILFCSAGFKWKVN